MPFELQVALRYLLAKRRQVFISIISLVSTLGVTVGVMALIVALAMMTGLQGELRDRLVGAQAHIFVHKSGGLGPIDDEIKALRTVPHVTGAAPTVLGYGLIRSADREDYLSLKGIDPALERDVTNVGDAMIKGSLDAVAHTPGEIPGIVLGKELSEKLGVTVDDTVEVVRREGPLTAFEIAGPLDFSTVGVLAGLLDPLAKQGISILAMSTFDTDWILVDARHADEAMAIWKRDGNTAAPARLSGGAS